MAVSKAFLSWLITIFTFVNAGIDVGCTAPRMCADAHIQDDIEILEGYAFDAMPNATFNYVSSGMECQSERAGAPIRK